MRPSSILGKFAGSEDAFLVNLLPALFTIAAGAVVRYFGRSLVTWFWRALRKNPILTLSLVAFTVVTLRVMYDESGVAIHEYRRAIQRGAVCERSAGVQGADMDEFCNNEMFVRESFLVVRILRNTIVHFENLLVWLWATANWVVRGLFLGWLALLTLSIVWPLRQKAVRLDMDAFQQQRALLTQQLYEQHYQQQLAAASGAPSIVVSAPAGLPPPMRQPPHIQLLEDSSAT